MVQRDGGGEFAIGYEIVELVEPELIVLRSDPMPEVGMHEPSITRAEFHDHGAKTRMTLSDGPYPAGRDHAEAGRAAAFATSRRLSPNKKPDCMGQDQPGLVQRLTSGRSRDDG